MVHFKMKKLFVNAFIHCQIVSTVLLLVVTSSPSAGAKISSLRTIYRAPAYYPIPQFFTDNNQHQQSGDVKDEENEFTSQEMEDSVAMPLQNDVPDMPKITWGQPNTQSIIYFDDTTPTNITAVVGQKAVLPCRVVNIGRKDVTWIRKRDIHILTVGMLTYTSDERFKVDHKENSDDWNLEISPLTFRDAGVYECQVSTSPKISLPVLLAVDVQQARIEGPNELFIRNGSTISLTCRVNTHSENVGHVTWLRDGQRLDYDSPRGGVSLEIEKTPEKTTSKLHITRAVKVDSGNYTCAPEHADAASVTVHVVSGEESAAVQSGSSRSVHCNDMQMWTTYFSSFVVCFSTTIFDRNFFLRRISNLNLPFCHRL